MNNPYLKNNFLARWISGELSPEELNMFEKSDDYVVFKRINEASQQLNTPNFDKSGLLRKINAQKLVKAEEARPKVVKLIPTWAYAVAASVIIALAVFYTLNTESHFETKFSEQLALSLPDMSKVKLNSNSQLDFKKLNWDSNREVTLNGEAFFDVEKGTTFKVVTNEGIIEVLGTEFNVISRNDYFEVQCHEGRVRVVNNSTSKETILTRGNAVRFVNDNPEEWNFNQESPDWLRGESTFKNAPLSQVIIALENEFNVSFDTSNINTAKRFTGGFTHKDLRLALKTVFSPMEISYSKGESNSIILSNSLNKIQSGN